REPARHQGKAVRLEGELKSLRRLDPPVRLQDRGVRDLYHAQILAGPGGSIRLDLVVTERAHGLRTGRRVEFEAFFFKKEVQPGDEPRQILYLIGRSLRPAGGPGKPEPKEDRKKEELQEVPDIGPLLADVKDGTRIAEPRTDPLEFVGYCE